MGRQLLRSGTSVGAQYREAMRAKSTADFISKMEGSLQELEESEYWLELLGESGFVPEERLAAIKKETGELKGIFIAIVRNTKAKSQVPKTVAPRFVYPLSLCLYPFTSGWNVWNDWNPWNRPQGAGDRLQRRRPNGDTGQLRSHHPRAQ
jgi:four helix bundle protein